MKSNKKQKRDEFRIHKGSGHPAYIYVKEGDEFKFLGITHSQITKNTTNIPLEKNPDPQDPKPAYIKKKPESDKTTHFKERKKDWHLSDKDKKTVKDLINKNAKKKPKTKK